MNFGFIKGQKMAKKVAKNEKKMKISRFRHLIRFKFKINQLNEKSKQQQPQTFNNSHFLAKWVVWCFKNGTFLVKISTF